MRKRPKMPVRCPRGITSTVKRNDEEVKTNKDGLWITVRSLDIARADEAEEERRGTDPLFGLVPLSSSSP
jgi:hypothetical protein